MRYLLSLSLHPLLSLAAPQLVQPAHPLAVGTSATLDGVRLDMIPARPAVAEVVSAAIPRTGWTVTCDSSKAGNDCSKAIDGDSKSFWLTDASAPLPHSIVVDMKTSRIVGNITIQPRQDGTLNGNIGQHQVSLRYVGPYDLLQKASDAKLARTAQTGALQLQLGPISTTISLRLPSSHQPPLAT